MCFKCLQVVKKKCLTLSYLGQKKVQNRALCLWRQFFASKGNLQHQNSSCEGFAAVEKPAAIHKIMSNVRNVLFPLGDSTGHQGL